MLLLSALLGTPTAGLLPDDPAPTGRVLAANVRPVAYMISSESRFTKERTDLLEAIGFSSERVDPVYMTTDCNGGNDTKKSAMWGITHAHMNAMKRIASSGRRGLILESDWDIGDQEVPDLKTAMARALARDEHYVSVGWCRGSRPSSFTCGTAYFMSPEAATNFTKLKATDTIDADVASASNASAPCFPIDALIVGACKDRSSRWKEWGIRLDGRCCWWPGDAVSTNERSFPGHGSRQRGMFQQDRDTYVSTHNSGTTEDEADAEDIPGLSNLGSFNQQATSVSGPGPWYRLQEPGSCM